jgi:hypothetical protein
MVVVYVGSFGGYLLAQPPIDGPPISVMLASSEYGGTINGLSHGGSDNESAALLRALQDNKPDEVLADLGKDQPKLSDDFSLSSSFIAGTPRWVPNWRSEANDLASPDLEPLDRLAFLLDAGCAENSFEDCVGRLDKMKGDTKVDPFSAAETAAKLDLEHNSKDAASGYRQAASQLKSILESKSPDVSTKIGAASAPHALHRVMQLLEARAQGVDDEKGRHVVILPVAVDVYDSPLIAGVPHASSDVSAIASTIAARLNPSPAEVARILAPRTADELLSAIRKESSRLGPEDLLVLVFSGRGVEQDGRRYLALAGTSPNSRPTNAPTGLEVVSEKIRWAPEGLADLSNIALAGRGPWFVAIYDAQFTPRSTIRNEGTKFLINTSIRFVPPRRD